MRGAAWMLTISSASEPTARNLCGVPDGCYDYVTGRRLDGSIAEVEAGAPCLDHEGLGVGVTVQRRSLSRAHVHDEERDLRTVDGALESACPISGGGPPPW
jgi:hypothetical protein